MIATVNRFPAKLALVSSRAQRKIYRAHQRTLISQSSWRVLSPGIYRTFGIIRLIIYIFIIYIISLNADVEIHRDTRTHMSVTSCNRYYNELVTGSLLDRAREQLSISAIIEMAAAARSIATVGETTPRHVTTLSIPLSPDYRVAIDSCAASVHIGLHPLPCAQNRARH